MVIGYFIDFMCSQQVKGFEEITFAMVSSKLYYDFEINCQEGMSRKEVLKIVKKFFEFIYQRHGIRNEKLMQKLTEAKVSNKKINYDE